MLRNIFFFIFLVFKSTIYAQVIPDGQGDEVLPKSLLQLDDQFVHHILIAEKATHKVHLYENKRGLPRYVKSYNAATGKRMGNKLVKGDLKTPEGIYSFQQFLPRNELVKKWGKEGEQYGAGAFTSNYPNPIDRLLGKTGGGIWLHSTNDNSRINKGLDSRGCVVVVDEDLKDLAKYIELRRTPMIIVQNIFYLPQKRWLAERDIIRNFISQWLKQWKNEDLDNYMSHYSRSSFIDHRKGNWQNFKSYKRAVFSRKGKPEIGISHLSILTHDNYAVVTFKQDYSSEKINDAGKKILHLKRDKNYEWKIISESWSKIQTAREGEFVFTPSHRFFQE